MQRLVTMATFLAMTSSALSAELPAHCESNKQHWWAKYVANGRVNLSSSMPDEDIAFVTWHNGVQQVLVLNNVENQGYCATDQYVTAE